MVVSILLIFSSTGSVRDLARFAAKSWAALRSTSALELTDFGFSVIVLYRVGMSTCGLANHNVSEPDHSVVSLHRNAASDANQQAEPQVGERHPHLSDDRSRGVIAWLMETRNNDIVARDLAKVVHIVICRKLWQTLMLLVQHL
jgi:hypothetical protein